MRMLGRVLATAALVFSALLTGLAAPARAAPAPDVLAYGAPDLGSTATVEVLNAPIVGIESTRDGGGYWEVAADGAVFAYGNATFAGSTGSLQLNKPIVGMAADSVGSGYWLVASDGGIFSFDATFHGSTGAMRLNRPIVGMARYPKGAGYWLVASDGGIFTFGDAPFLGSTGAMRLNSPIVGMAPTRSGEGYWMVASDGGIFSFGDASFAGSTGDIRLVSPIVGMAADRDGDGYWLAAGDGGVFAFSADFKGSAGGADLGGKQVTGIAADVASGGYWLVLERGHPALRQGDAGEAVSTLQRRLTALGYWLGSGNGSFGGSTHHAVVALQKTAGLARTGVVDEATWRAIDQGIRPRAHSSSGRVIEVDLGHQTLTVMEGGAPRWIFDTSTGRPGLSTPVGHHTIFSQVASGVVDGAYRPKYFSGHLSIHGYESVPPYPFSHGCARLTMAAMDFLWASGLAPVGTPVWVY